MNRHVGALAGRLSLRAPQREALEILDRLTELVPIRSRPGAEAALAAIRRVFPQISDFERDFPSVCFALATGVGKTRLMGAFIGYLYLAHGVRNFFVLAPNLTIYEKLIGDFTPKTAKYVFKGIAEFATNPPGVITGDDYEQRGRTLFDDTLACRVNIFNISKLNVEVRGGRSPRIKRLSEYIGESYFEYLAGLPDLVLLMDESHRYRASAGVRAINELRPLLGLELTATPFVERAGGQVAFRNVIYEYPLARAIADGFVKEPAVVTRKDFDPSGLLPDEIERLKLEDGIRLHESLRVELETYARSTGNSLVKPFVLVIARDTNHAARLQELVRSEAFFEGRYKEKVIQVDSSQAGAAEDEMIHRLLRVERTDEATEIVIHVNMLKEGWDVTNLYTIIPLRPANARTLIEQSIGRGLRLPYGRRTGVTAVDRLNIVAHDRFREIVEEAQRPGSQIQLQQVVLGHDDLYEPAHAVISQSVLDSKLGFRPASLGSGSAVGGLEIPPAFIGPAEQQIARIAVNAIRDLEGRPDLAPTVASLRTPEVQALLVERVAAAYSPTQMALAGVTELPSVARIVAEATELVALQTIEIPRILVVPRGEVHSGFHPFRLQLETMNYPPPAEELWIQHLRTEQLDVVGVGGGGIAEVRLEDYVVRGLIDFDDVSYDSQSELLYDLASQVVEHLRAYLSADDAQKVLRFYQRDIAGYVHAQMEGHFWEAPVDYEIRVSKGFTALKESAYTQAGPLLDFRVPPASKAQISKYVFGGFERCLYAVQKFQSDPERVLAIILDRDALKWFKPARGQFQISYRWNGEYAEYQPDFVAEAGDRIYMLEPKARNLVDDPEVQAKRGAAVLWCGRASEFASKHGTKEWSYVLIPHDAIAENMTLAGLVRRFVS